MRLFKSKLGKIFGAAYLAVFLFCGLYAMYFLVFHTRNSEFSGLYVDLVTLPWSMFPIPVWYDRFAGNPAVYGFFAMLTLLPVALMNALILYFVGKLFEMLLRGKA